MSKTLDAVPKYSNEVFEDKLLLTYVAVNLSFNFADNPQFCRRLQIARPGIEPPTRQHRRQLPDTRSTSQVEELFSDLGPYTKVSLALDCWTSQNLKSFLAITAYYTSTDWEYREVLLGFEPVVGSHTGYYLALIVKQVLQQFSLADQLYATTADIASNNQTLRTSLEAALHSLGLS